MNQMNHLRRGKKFNTLIEAEKFKATLKGDVYIKLKEDDKYKVIYETKLNKKNPAKYKTIKFKSLHNATSFCNRLKEEGKIININQNINVKTISDTLHKIKFIFDKSIQKKEKHNHDFWQDYGDLAYSGVTDDF
jgi:hypothetical protein